MVTHVLAGARLHSGLFHASSLGSVGLCIGLWIRAKTVDQEERGNAERRALFVGLWAPTLWLMGDGVERRESERRGRLRPRGPRASVAARASLPRVGR